MKNKDFNELKTKSIKDIKKKIAELEKEKEDTKIELSLGKIKNVHIINQKKKDIAKAKTLLTLKLLLEKEGKNDAN